MDIEKMVAEARAKAEAVRARLAAARGGATQAVPPAASSPAPGSPAPSAAMSKLEQMKARVAAATSRANAPSQHRPSAPAPSHPPAFDDEGLSKARGGLDVGLHPALLSDKTPDFRGAKGKGGNRRDTPGSAFQRGNKARLDLSGPSIEDIKNNPYFDPSLDPKATVAKPRNSS
jgi:U4/U6 small nuclear ribonucleoprotein PRP3